MGVDMGSYMGGEEVNDDEEEEEEEERRVQCTYKFLGARAP